VLEEIKLIRRDVAIVGYCPAGRSLPETCEAGPFGIASIVLGEPRDSTGAPRAVAHARRDAVTATSVGESVAIHAVRHTVIEFSVRNSASRARRQPCGGVGEKPPNAHQLVLRIGRCARRLSVVPILAGERCSPRARLVACGAQLGSASSVSFRSLLSDTRVAAG